MTGPAAAPRGGLDVVVPTRDRPEALGRCLAALRAQTLPAFGLIVVDDGSREPVVLTADAAGAGRHVRVVRHVAPRGPAAARNHGAELSAADTLVFLDDDCLAVAGLLERHHRAVRGAADVLSLGPILAPPGRRLTPWSHWDADRLAREYARIARGERPVTGRDCYTGNLGVSRVAFATAGGFDTRLARQEDVELGLRLARRGARIRFDPDAVVHHDCARPLRTWLALPGVSARHDVLVDRLDPGAGHLEAIRAERASRHPALRWVRPLTRSRATARATVASAVVVGRLLHGVRLDRPALAAFSLVFDVEYGRALAERADGVEADTG